MMNEARNPKIEDITGLNILPEGTRIFFRNAFLFGDIRSRMGRVCGFHVSVEAKEWLGSPELEYYVQVGREMHWIPAKQVEGFIMGI